MLELELRKALEVEPPSPPIIDPGFKINAVHRRYIRFASERGGNFSFHAYNRHLLETTKTERSREQQLDWGTRTVQSMAKAGWFIKVSNSEYSLNPLSLPYLAELDRNRKPEFQPGDNHRKVMILHTEGTVTLATIRDALLIGDARNRARQDKILQGMVRNLRENGYLTLQSRGVYALTEKALIWLEQPSAPQMSRRKTQHPPGFSLTNYDLRFLEHIHRDPDTGKATLVLGDSVNEDTQRLAKRLVTLEKNGVVLGGEISDAIVLRLELMEMARREKRTLSLSMLTTEQKNTLQELRRFDALTMPQIIDYLYSGDALLAGLDMSRLVSLKVVQFDSGIHSSGLLLLDKQGVKLSEELARVQVRYKPKARSRPEEVSHDLMIYPAYKSIEKEIIDAGGTVVAVLTEKEIRREMALYDTWDASLPDLRIIYRDYKGQEHERDVEIDLGYSLRTIAHKVSSFIGDSHLNHTGHTTLHSSTGNITWVTTSMSQAIRVMSFMKSSEQFRSQRRRRKFELYVLDERGDSKKVWW